METNFITLRENNSLHRFCKKYNKTLESVTDKVISTLLRYKLIHDIPEESGETLQYVLDQNDTLLDTFCVACFGSYGHTIGSYVKDFQLWGLHYDCENCGCELEDGKCTNCNNDTNDYPDFDSMPGGHDYDCHSELTKNINLN